MKLTKAERKILKLVSDGSVTAKQIAERSELHYVYVINRLRRLAELGLISQIKAVTVYEISIPGVEALNNESEV